MKIKFSDILDTLAKLTAPPPPRRYPFDDPKILAKAHRARRRAAQARQRLAGAKVEVRLKDERAATGRRMQGAWGQMMHQVILRAMEPGGWYARLDVVNLTGFERNPVQGKLKEMMEKGLLRREQNPAWDPKHHPSPQALQAGVEVKEPQWLYTLTGEGEKMRARLPIAATEPSGAQVGDIVTSQTPP